MMDFVSWDDDMPFPTEWKVIILKFHGSKPPMNQIFIGLCLSFSGFLLRNPSRSHDFPEKTALLSQDLWRVTSLGDRVASRRSRLMVFWNGWNTEHEISGDRTILIEFQYLSISISISMILNFKNHPFLEMERLSMKKSDT
jgi:hypothetical protein